MVATRGCLLETLGTLWMRSLVIVVVEYAKSELTRHYYKSKAFSNKIYEEPVDIMQRLSPGIFRILQKSILSKLK